MKCENCTGEHDGQFGAGRFCQLSCARQFAAKRGRNRSGISLLIEKRCQTCGAPSNRRFGGTNRYCQEHKRKVKSVEEITSGKCLKRHLLKMSGRICASCQLTEWLGNPIPIQLDHVDGNPDNNQIENLRLLCPNCHACTPTFSGKNRGRFPDATRNVERKSRRSND